MSKTRTVPAGKETFERVTEEETIFSEKIANGLGRSLSTTRRAAKHRSTLEHCAKLRQFSEEMSVYMDRRNILADSQVVFQSRQSNFSRFISENLNKLQRQQRAIMENRIVREHGLAELQSIHQKTEEALKRRDELLQKLTTLRHYESLLSGSLSLLPKDYFRANANAPDSLIKRFSMLRRLQKLLLSELHAKQESVQKENWELNRSRIVQLEELLTKISSIQYLGSEWSLGMENQQQCKEKYERGRERVAEECVRFMAIIRALRNIAEKAASGLYNLHSKQISNQHKVTLQTNFRVILRFLNVVTAIQEEISPTTKKQPSLVEQKNHTRTQTRTHICGGQSQDNLSDTASRDNKPVNVRNRRILPLFSSRNKGIDDTDGE